MLRFIDASGNDLGQGLLPVWENNFTADSTFDASTKQVEDTSEFTNALPLLNDESLQEGKSASSVGIQLPQISRTLTQYDLVLSSGGVQRGVASLGIRVSQSIRSLE